LLVKLANVPSQIAIFAAGCFWGVEHIFLKHYPPLQHKGILKTAVGYTGGKTPNPGYKDVCSGATNHAEAVRIEFDPGVVSYAELVGESMSLLDWNEQRLTKYLEFFYRTHDPTTVNRQGGDSGTRTSLVPFIVRGSTDGLLLEYRSVIFTNSDDQVAVAKRVTAEVQEKHFTPKGQKIVTEIIEVGTWWDAEDYHQLYLYKNPDGYQCPTHRLHW
jgi:peptide-methionine (S)-S-oxide reductase